jgi:uncharacterized protein YjdB
MPTASTSQILGNNECIEPFTSNMYTRRVLAGEAGYAIAAYLTARVTINAASAQTFLQGAAIAVGTATVSATADGKSASVQVTVTPERAATVAVTPATVTLRRTNTRQLTAVARNAQNQVIDGRTFRWNSSNTAIVAVDQTGRVTAVAAGTATISAETDQTVGLAQMVVTEVPIGACTLAPTSFRVTTGQSVQPQLTLRDTASNVIPTLGRSIAWTSGNENVATVTQTGFATTRRAGTATITAASAEYPNITCSATVEAVDPRIAQVIISPRVGALRLGAPRGFGVLLLDSANVQIPSGRIVTWTTSTPTIAQVSQAGLVTGLSLGTARIIATAEGTTLRLALALGVDFQPLRRLQLARHLRSAEVFPEGQVHGSQG